MAPNRVLLIISYLLLVSAGIAGSIWHSASVSQAGFPVATLWALFLTVGGASCAYGVMRRNWLGEYIGLPLLVAVWMIYGISSGYSAIYGNRSAIGGSLALTSVASLLAWRWRGIVEIRKAASRGAMRRKIVDKVRERR